MPRFVSVRERQARHFLPAPSGEPQSYECGVEVNMDHYSSAQQKAKGQFPWTTYGRDILMLLSDLALLLLVIIAVSFIVTFSVGYFWRDLCPALTNDNVVQIVKYLVWPCVAFIFVFLFRNAISRILYATMCFIFKSHYRHGDKVVSQDATPSSPMMDSEDLEVWSVDVEESNDNAEKVETARKLAFSLLDLAAREVALNKMQADFSLPVLRKYSITSFKYGFDGIIDFPEGEIFGIKVRRTKSAEDWKEEFSKMSIAYLKWKLKHKCRFFFVICAIGRLSEEEQNKLINMAHALPCNTLIRICDYAGRVLKEVP